MQTRSIDGSGEPAWVIASTNACERLGPDPRKALWPAALCAAQTGRTHDRTDQCCSNVKKALANQAPSTHELVRANDVMQTRSIDGSGEPAWVIASTNACERLGPDPRKALWPAALCAAQTGRTHDRTDQCCSNVKKALANQAPSTHDPKRTMRGQYCCDAEAQFSHCPRKRAIQ